MRELPIHPILDRQTLIEEFRSILRNPDIPVLPNTQGVVILSGHYDTLPDKTIKEDSIENVARIGFGVQLLKRIASARTHRAIEEVDFNDVPPLILNGETEQLPAMERVALNMGVPIEKIELVNCGRRGVGNTKTQFTTMEKDKRFQGLKHLIFVTSAYHVPRVERTAKANLPNNHDIEVFPVPITQYPFSLFMIRGEIKRILQYAQKGDIAKFPDRLITNFQE